MQDSNSHQWVTALRDSCHSVINRRKELTSKLLKNPFFPILFIGEAIKTAAIAHAQTGTIFTETVWYLTVAALIVTSLWLIAEEVLDEASEYVESVTDE